MTETIEPPVGCSSQLDGFLNGLIRDLGQSLKDAHYGGTLPGSHALHL
jgi:hypothetical protein